MKNYYKNFRSRLIWRLHNKGKFDKLTDEKAIKLLYWASFHKLPNLKNPQTYNEKLQWLKLNDRNPKYTTMVDKYQIKGYVSDIIGKEYVIPLLGVWDNFDQIDFEKLPNQFVLKTNHAGGVCICYDKEKGKFRDKLCHDISFEEVKKHLTKELETDYYLLSRGWPYKNVERKIIAEAYLNCEKNKNITDYKFFCFDGDPKFYYIVSNNLDDVRCTFFDMNNKKLEVWQHDKDDDIENVQFPQNLELMKNLCKLLTKDIPHVRCDLYEVDGKVFFGEFTFSNWSGFEKFNPNEYDKIFGDYINLKFKEELCYEKDF